MKLFEWQEKDKLTDLEVAKRIGVHPSYISHINAERRRPSPEIALKIEEVSGGKVTIRDLLYPEAAKDSNEQPNKDAA